MLKWSRIAVAGKPHKHSFVRNGDDKRFTSVTVDGTAGKAKLSATVSSGIVDLLVLKTTESSFEDYVFDEFTTLKRACFPLLPPCETDADSSLQPSTTASSPPLSTAATLSTSPRSRSPRPPFPPSASTLTRSGSPSRRRLWRSLRRTTRRASRRPSTRCARR